MWYGICVCETRPLYTSPSIRVRVRVRVRVREEPRETAVHLAVY